MASTCKRIADSGLFQGFILGVIVLNAVTLGHPDLRPLGEPRQAPHDARRHLPRDLRRRAHHPDHRVRLEASGLLPGRLERLRLRRDLACVRPRHPRERDPPADRPPPAGGARRHRAPRPPRSRQGAGPLDSADPESRGPDADADVRLRHGRLDPVPRAGSGELGRHRPGDALDVHDADARELADASRSRHGDPPAVVDLLRLLRPARLVPGHQHPDRDHHQLGRAGAPGRARGGACRAAGALRARRRRLHLRLASG